MTWTKTPPTGPFPAWYWMRETVGGRKRAPEVVHVESVSTACMDTVVYLYDGEGGARAIPCWADHWQDRRAEWSGPLAPPSDAPVPPKEEG